LISGREGPKSKASRDKDKNVGNVFEQRNALARLRVPLRDEGHIRAGRAGRDAAFCVFAIGPSLPRWHLASRRKRRQICRLLLLKQLAKRRRIQHYADKHHQADIVIVEEALKAGVALAANDQLLLVEEQRGGTEQRPVKEGVKLH